MARTGGRRVLRHRLSAPFLQRLEPGRFGVISAGPGFGKSTFLTELAAAWPHMAERDAPRDTGEVLRWVEAAAAVTAPLLLLFDDAHRLGAHAAALEELLERLPRRHRLVAATRGDDGRLASLCAARDAPIVTADDLRFSLSETAEALGLAHAASAVVHAVTVGWPEGVGLLAHSDVDLGDRHVVEALLRDELRGRLHAAGGRSRPLIALLDARVPLTRRLDGRWILPAPLARHLPAIPALSSASMAPPHVTPPAVLAMSTCDVDLSPAGLRRLGPRVLHLLRDAELREDDAAFGELLLRALAAYAGHPGTMGDLLEGDRLRGLLRQGFAGQARRGALGLLGRTSSDAARARALDVLARAARRGAGEHDLLLAGDLLAESLALWRRLGQQGRVEEARLRLARVDLDLGQAQRALRRVESVMAAPGAPVALVRAATLLRLMALGDLGHAGEPGKSSDPTPEGAILRANAALLRDEPAEAARCLRGVDVRLAGTRGALRAPRALAAAELWCRAGDARQAMALTAWARRSPAERTAAVRLGFAAVEARAGNAVAGLMSIDTLLDSGAVAPRELWRAHLLAAVATARLGGSPAPRLDQALRAATAIGQPGAPYLRERELLAELLDMPGVWRSEARA